MTDKGLSALYTKAFVASLSNTSVKLYMLIYSYYNNDNLITLGPYYCIYEGFCHRVSLLA